MAQSLVQCYMHYVFSTKDRYPWLKTLSPDFKGFHWQAGYGAFSVSPHHIDALAQYIANQQKHHLGESYQDEMRRLCKYYGIKLDEKYAWE